MTMGTRPATATIATAKSEAVSAYTWSMTATMVSCPPMPDRVEPIHIRANAGLARNGRRSMRWRAPSRAISG
ncbi:hypothetical protein QE381_001251 [Microbacterium sp. SORGH_AS 888]|nr:hypothetical protein [Microbacterium sp. SORGH_AS_0888]